MTTEDRDGSERGAGGQEERAHRVRGELGSLEQHDGHERRRHQRGDRRRQGATRQQEHACGRRDGESHVQVPVEEHETGHVLPAHQGEELDERVGEQTRRLGEILLVDERSVAERPAPGHEHEVRLIDQVGAAVEPPPRETQGRREERRDDGWEPPGRDASSACFRDAVG